ncbi:MAG TPA: hypothetical protein VKU02_28165 [Gemmataceae bacterium]|nr:hypothetical protein [Gemmataceae bacterium]
MGRLATVTLTILLVTVGGAAGADEKDAAKSKPLGIWKRSLGDHSITFAIRPDTLQVVVKSGGNTLQLEADYGVSKDGVLFARVSKVVKDVEGPSEGDLFSLRFKVHNDTLTVSELKSPHEGDGAKELVEGEYRRQKGSAE